MEVNKGANSLENGAGQVSGGVNLVSKKPLNKDKNLISVGLGTDDYTRFTGDFNKVINSSVAARLNVMGHKNQYPGGPEKAERWGIAPSITIGMDSDTQATFSYLHQKDENDPMYGIPNSLGKFVPGIQHSNRYGYRNLDIQKIDADIATINVQSKINDQLKLNSITRYSDIHQQTTISAPQGTFCLSSGLTTLGASCSNPGVYTVSGPRGFYRSTETKQLVNDTNLNLNFKTAAIDHALVFGGGFSQEEYEKYTGGYLYDSAGNALARPTMSVYNPDNYWHGQTNFNLTGHNTGKLNIYSAYLIDTLKFNPQWMLNLGVRYDRTEGDFRSATRTTTTGVWTLNDPTHQSNNLLSYNAALTFKPTESSSIYASYSNAQKPTSFSASSSCTDGKTCDVDPEEAVSYEIGAKWEINPDLLLTGAIFRNEQNKVRVSDSSNTRTFSLDGKNHVDGVELGLAGNLTPRWAVTASAAYMKGKYDQTVADSVITTDFKKGTEMTNIPEWSGSLWSTYSINPKWSVGYGLTYQGKMWLSDVSGTSTVRGQSDDYVLHNASLTYKYSKDFTFNLIVKNLTDKEYLTHFRNNGWATVGAERSTVLSVDFAF